MPVCDIRHGSMTVCAKHCRSVSSRRQSPYTGGTVEGPTSRASASIIRDRALPPSVCRAEQEWRTRREPSLAHFHPPHCSFAASLTPCFPFAPAILVFAPCEALHRPWPLCYCPGKYQVITPASSSRLSPCPSAHTFVFSASSSLNPPRT